MKYFMVKCDKGLEDLLGRIFDMVSNDHNPFYYTHPGFSSIKRLSNGWNKIPGKLLNRPMIKLLEQMFTKKNCRKVY